MNPSKLALAALFTLMLCAACAGGGPAPELRAGTTAPAAFDIPAPADAARTAQSITQERLRLGFDYVPGLTAHTGGDNPQLLGLQPAYNGVDSFDFAWAIYGFTLNDYDDGNAVKVYFYDDLPAPPAGTIFLGLSDFAANCWRWYPVDPDGYVETGNIGAMLNESNELFAAVVAIGEEPAYVTALLIGGVMNPVAVPTASDTLFLDTNPVDLSGAESVAYDVAIASYEWDLDGDGTFEESGEALVGQLFAPGLHEVRLKVTDVDGLSDTGALYLQSVDADNLPEYLEIEDNDTLETAQQLPSMGFSGIPGNLGPLGLNDGDRHDWFRFDLPVHGAIAVHLGHNFAEVDLALEVTNANGVVLASSDNKAGLEDVLLMSLPAGSYYIHCYTALDNGDSGDYGLAIETLYGVAPIALLSGSATDIVQGGSLNLNASSSYDPDGMIDYYEWDLYGDGDFERVTDGDSVTSYSNIMRVGTFTARVKVVDTDGFYTIAEWEYTVSGDQQYDEMEDNDSQAAPMLWPWFPESSFPSFIGDIGDGGGNNGDTMDWFEFELTEAGDVQFICAPLDTDHGGLNLYLYSVGGILITGDESANPVKGIQNPETLPAGTYRVLIEADHGATRYDMSGHFIPEM